MRSATRRALAACLLPFVLCGTGFGAIKNNYVAPEARAAAGGRDVYIVVPQAEIKGDIKAMNSAVAGGLLFALIDAGVNNARAKNAEKLIVPMREALVGYEFDPRVQTATSSTLTGLGWFDPKGTKFTKDQSPDPILAALDAGDTPQLMVLRYDYAATADFSAVTVSLHASLVNKAVPKGKKPDVRVAGKYLAFNQFYRSVIKLPEPDPKDPEANVKAWAANGGQAARMAIERGIEGCQQLLKRSMALSAADALSIQKRNKREISKLPDAAGWVIEKQDSHMVVYELMTSTLVQVETLDSAAIAAAPAGVPGAAPAASQP